MIAKWKVGNFKSISKETELDFAPLTIFAGANSSGKSTIIQSVLLVAQTVANKVGSRSVVLNGALTSLGQFDDLKSADSGVDLITIKCTLQPLPNGPITTYPTRQLLQGRTISRNRPGRLIEVASEIAFDANSSDVDKDLYQIQPRLFASNINCTYRDRDSIDLSSSIAIRLESKEFLFSQNDDLFSEESPETVIQGQNYAVYLDEEGVRELREEYFSAVPIGCVFRHFLPEKIICKIDKVVENAYTITQWLLEVAFSSGGYYNMRSSELVMTSHVMDILKSVLNEPEFQILFDKDTRQTNLFHSDAGHIFVEQFVDNIRSLKREQRERARIALKNYEPLFQEILEATQKVSLENATTEIVSVRPERKLYEAIGYLHFFFSNSLRYLGPLREAPRPIYPLSPAADPNEIGLHGEHTAAVLELHKNRKISYIPSGNFRQPIVNRDKSIRTLEGAVNDWLQYLGVAKVVSTKDRGKLGHELKVDLGDAGISHDLTHVGVGVSQVLPILVMCFLAKEDSTLVFEQPELHLHPKVQTLLGDFFLSMAFCNKQCIVETHSEYLIDRLRFRMASAPIEEPLSSLAQVYFVEKMKGVSQFRSVKINDFGAITDWPDGFFDQSQSEAEAILRAAARKRDLLKRGSHGA